MPNPGNPTPPGANRPGGGGGPTYTLPPPKPKAALSAGAAFDRFMRAHPALLPYADAIWKWSKQYGVPAVVLAALLWQESRGNPNARNKKSGALGLAQIVLDKYGKFKGWRGQTTPWGEVIDDAFAQNPESAVRFAAWYLSSLNEGDWDAAYFKYSGGSNVKLSSLYPKGFVPRESGLSPEQAASTSAERAAARADLTDPYIAGVNKKGKLIFTTDPERAIQFDGIPVRRTDFLRVKRELDETYVFYTGRRPSNKDVAVFIRNSWSAYTLTRVLSRSPEFFNSPAWKQNAPGYKAIIRQMYGPQAYNPDLFRDLIRDAIVGNWEGGTFQSVLRQRPDYIGSNEFKSNAATLGNVFQTIYGTPDQRALRTIQQAALAGWTPDQYAGWLRSQDEYQFTPEYRDKAFRLVEALGFMTGQVPTLTPGVAPTAPTPDTGLPNDPRITGQTGLPTGPYLQGGALA